MANQDYVISSASFDRFYFEIELLEFPSHSMDFTIGYVQLTKAETLRQNPRYFLGGNGEQALCVSEFKSYFEVYSGYKVIKTINYKNKSNKKQRLKSGDKIGIEFNFMSKKSLVYFNGSCVGLMGEDIPDKVMPAVSLTSRGITIACSQWKAITYA